MKRTLKIAAVYIGMVIGAGFASGREVLEYFNLQSGRSFAGIILATVMFISVAYIVLTKASEEGIDDFDTYICSVAGGAAPIIKYFMLAVMFCGLFVMLAGSGALIEALTPLSDIYGICLMAVICFLALCFDIKGLVLVNAVLVPIMICGIVYVSVCTIIFGNTAAFAPSEYIGGGIMLSAVCYSAYNTLTAGAVLVPLARGTGVREIRIASVGSGFIIGLLIMIVWTVQGISLNTLWDSELPMLELAAMCGKTCKRVYTAVLFMAICTTAVSYGFGLISHFRKRIKTRRQRALISAVLCAAALLPALYGFSSLVAELYSLIGYIGIIWTIWVFIDRIKSS